MTITYLQSSFHKQFIFLLCYSHTESFTRLAFSADERFIFVMNDSAARTNDFCPVTNDFPANGIKKEQLTLLTMICYDSNS